MSEEFMGKSSSLVVLAIYIIRLNTYEYQALHDPQKTRPNIAP